MVPLGWVLLGMSGATVLDFNSGKPQGYYAGRQLDDPDYPARLKERMAPQARSLLQYLWPNGRIVGTEFEVGSVNGERGHSLKISLRSDKLGVGCDFAGNEIVRDLIDCWSWAKRGRDARGPGFHELCEEIETWLGSPFKPKPKTANGEDKKKKRELGPPTGSYTYTDADGNVLVIVTRYDPAPGKKEFIPWEAATRKHAPPESNRPLYNQPGIKDQAHVVLTEGEKAADALNALGIPTTSAMGGSNAPVEKTDWSPLAGKHVLIWPDADAAGAKYARNAAEILQPIAASVRILENPPDKTDGWDAANAVAEGMDVHAFLNTATAVEQRPAFSILDWHASCFVGEPPARRWLVKDVLPLGCAGILAAMGDAGKGVMTLDLALKIACRADAETGLVDDGIPALSGSVAEHGAAVIFTAEDSQEEVHRRLHVLDPQGLRFQPDVRLYVIPLPNVGGPMPLVITGRSGPETTRQLEVVRQQLEAIEDLKLVVFDPLASFVLGDLNKDQAICSYATAVLAALAVETGATVLACHHMTKGNSKTPILTPEQARDAIRGQAAIVDGVRLAYALWPAEEKEARLTCKKLNTEWQRNRVFKGAVAKSNAPADRAVHTFVRDLTTGLLKDRTMELRQHQVFNAELLAMLTEAVREASEIGLPFTKRGKAGLYDQRARLPEELREFGRDRIEVLAQEALEIGCIVQARASGSNVAQWLDVPDGPFASGVGEFAEGAPAMQKIGRSGGYR